MCHTQKSDTTHDTLHLLERPLSSQVLPLARTQCKVTKCNKVPKDLTNEFKLPTIECGREYLKQRRCQQWLPPNNVNRSRKTS